jgi:phospho-N-acetylmuramoyl-pentapeptide-transferase
MGGIMFIAAFVICTLIFAAKEIKNGETRALAVMIFALVFAVIGFADDFIKVIKKRNLGLTGLQKIILQLLNSVAFLLYLAFNNYISTKVFFPFLNISLDLSWFFYVFALFAIVGFVNSVNLTDGLDGLATSVSIPVLTVLTILALNQGAMGISVLGCGLIGGLLGFLVYNFHPAKIFMGDTGSLFIGGALCGIAFVLNIPLIIFIAGIVFICEALSVMLQVLFFKTTGKRIFKMSPIHHHFELSGWKEVKIVYVFTAVTALFSIFAFFGFNQ